MSNESHGANGYDTFKYLNVSELDIAKASPVDRRILENVALVGFFAGKFASMANVSRDDIFQAGLEGLIRSAQMFDPSLNIKFSSYASVSIQHSIWNILDTSTYPVKVTYRVAKKIAEISKFIDLYHNDHTGEPSISLIAKNVGIDEDTAQMFYTLSKHVQIDIDNYYEDDVHHGDNLLSFETLAYDELFVLSEYMDNIYDVLESLPLLEGVVVLLRSGLYDTRDYSIAEVGYILELPPGRIRDIEFCAIQHMQKSGFLTKVKLLEEMNIWDYINVKVYEKSHKDLTLCGIRPTIYCVDRDFGDLLMSGSFEVTLIN